MISLCVFTREKRYNMITIYKHEMKTCIKSLLIWSVCVGGMGLACILLFSGMRESMEGMAENFASMGAFSDAFGMNRLSIATLAGFFATEVGTIHALGGSLFAAVLGAGMLSKEEDGHTGEFLFSLPISRGKVTAAKWCAVMTNVLLLNLFCMVLYLAGIVAIQEEFPMKEFFFWHIMQVSLQLELAAICFAISAFMRRSKLGLGLGIVLFLYAYDLNARIVPEMSDYKAVSPFSYANAADLLSAGEVNKAAAAIGAAVLLIALSTAFKVYTGRDLAA